MDEKKDMANVATPMCVLECDALYVKGYIEVKDGKIVNIKSQTLAMLHLISLCLKESAAGIGQTITKSTMIGTLINILCRHKF